MVFGGSPKCKAVVDDVDTYGSLLDVQKLWFVSMEETDMVHGYELPGCLFSVLYVVDFCADQETITCKCLPFRCFHYYCLPNTPIVIVHTRPNHCTMCTC